MRRAGRAPHPARMECPWRVYQSQTSQPFGNSESNDLFQSKKIEIEMFSWKLSSELAPCK